MEEGVAVEEVICLVVEYVLKLLLSTNNLEEVVIVYD